MTKKEIKQLAKEIMIEMDKEGLDMEIILNSKQLNKLADIIVDKLLICKIFIVIDNYYSIIQSSSHLLLVVN